jgi:hypothetical protein
MSLFYSPGYANICTSWGPASLRNVDFVWAAQALANNVFPVPGAPYNNTPKIMVFLMGTLM